MTEPTVRLARPEDANAIAAVRLAGWRGAYGPLLPVDAFDGVDFARWAERTRALIVARRSKMRIAERCGAVQGFCVFGRCRDEDLVGVSELYALYVIPEAWSTGLGRELMTVALGELDRSVVLWVLRDNPRARRFYEIAGFRPDGAEKTADVLGFDLPEVRYRLD